MSDQPPESPLTPDVRTIRYLVRLMQRYDLTAIDVVEGTREIRLRRRRDSAVSAAAAPAHSPSPAHAAPPPRAEPAAPPPTEPAGLFIESPMVGTFYAASAPDAPPFVTLGAAVRPDTIVCVIEAMKVFTDIPAGLSGTITEILVKNGQSVEFGQALFRVDPA